MNTNPPTEPTEPTEEEVAERARLGLPISSRKVNGIWVTPNEDAPEDAPEPEPAPSPRKPRTPAKKATTPTKTATPKAKVTPKAKPATKKAATPKPIFTKKGWQVAITRNQAIAAYRKQRTLLHGAGPEAYRKAAAKALDIEDDVFLAAFYAPKAEGKA